MANTKEKTLRESEQLEGPLNPDSFNYFLEKSGLINELTEEEKDWFFNLAYSLNLDYNKGDLLVTVCDEVNNDRKIFITASPLAFIREARELGEMTGYEVDMLEDQEKDTTGAVCTITLKNGFRFEWVVYLYELWDSELFWEKRKTRLFETAICQGFAYCFPELYQGWPFVGKGHSSVLKGNQPKIAKALTLVSEEEKVNDKRKTVDPEELKPSEPKGPEEAPKENGMSGAAKQSKKVYDKYSMEVINLKTPDEYTDYEKRVYEDKSLSLDGKAELIKASVIGRTFKVKTPLDANIVLKAIRSRSAIYGPDVTTELYNDLVSRSLEWGIKYVDKKIGFVKDTPQTHSGDSDPRDGNSNESNGSDNDLPF